MRTTITIDDNLVEELKRRAAERGTTVSRLIEESVRQAGAPEPDAEAEEFELVIYGEGERFTGIDLDRASAVLERDDLERYGRR